MSYRGYRGNQGLLSGSGYHLCFTRALRCLAKFLLSGPPCDHLHGKGIAYMSGEES